MDMPLHPISRGAARAASLLPLGGCSAQSSLGGNTAIPFRALRSSWIASASAAASALARLDGVRVRSLRLARARHCSTSLQPTSCPGKQYARCAACALPRVPMALDTHRRTEEGREADRSVHRVQGECQRYLLAGSCCGAAASHPTHRVSAAAGHASHAMLRCASHVLCIASI